MKSPLKAKPLNNPAESLERRLYDLALDRVLVPIPICILFVFMAIVEWYRWYVDVPPQPLLMSVLAVCVIAYFAFRFRGVWREIKQLKQGIAGEKAVGQFLERLRTDGAYVFHDVPGDKFNLDHVVIHGSGIYVVETKTLSKPDRGKTELHFDGLEVHRNDKPLPMNPVLQVSAASAWLAELLKESTGNRYSVRGLVTFPGWYIRSSKNTFSASIWVLNPKAIPSFISSQQLVLTSEEVNLIKFHLDRYIRAR
ncbi:nuclease [Aliidiomarina minuta]|uniref:Nuclease n=1 Tax=Aliidiomarina minuta TaxID=880057 RepID=A0A432W3K8_9GAMM|nr:nuclease-related domain-containing protein [Aliidiomarina minuta]RUO23922.1 nuclease [Aliidiomarina minuta]